MQNRLMKQAAVFSSLGLALAFTVSGCGGGSLAPPLTATSKTMVFVQDGNIMGALVQDGNQRTASAVPNSPGAYDFGKVVVLAPITIKSQNSAAIIQACLDTDPLTICDPAQVKTYQDLDGNGIYSTGDVLYNGSFNIHYIPTTAGNIIYANPLSGLIPFGGAAPAVAGLTAAEVLASANGDMTKAPAKVRSVAAQLVAVQEALVNTGANPAAVADFVRSIGANATGGTLAADITAALTGPKATLATTLYPAASVPSQANLIAAASNIATAVAASMAGAAVGSNNYESIIAVTGGAVPVVVATPAATYIQQLAAGLNTSGASLNQTITASRYDIQSGVVKAAVNSQNVLKATLVNGLFLMPVYNLASKVAAATSMDAYTKFSLTYDAIKDSITINGVNSAISPPIAGKVLNFDTVAGMYGFADTVNKIFVSINLNFSGARVLSYCTDYAGNPNAKPVCTLTHLTLPTQAEVCGLSFNDGTFFADQTVAGVFTAGHADYAVGARFTTMNGQTSICP